MKLLLAVLHPLLPEWARRLTESEHEEEEEEDVYAELNTPQLATLILSLVTLIIVISVAFELMKHSLVHHTREGLMPVVEAMFSELTTLGFLSLLTYLLEQNNVFDTVSERLFENEVVPECFEVVHMGIFFVAVVFTVEVVLFLRVGGQLEDYWTVTNCDAQDAKVVASEEAILHLEPGFWNFGGRARKRKAERFFEFVSFREEFLLGRQVHPPFAPMPEEDRLPRDFDYGRYLVACYAHIMSEVVEKPVSTWGCLLVLLLVFYLILLALDCRLGSLMWVWLALDWALVGALQLQGYRLGNVKGAMLNPVHIPAKDLSQSMGPHLRLLSKKNCQHEDKPLWASRPAPDKRNILRRLSSAHAFNRQHDLFIMGGKGPDSHLFVLRLLTFLQAIVISVYFICLLGFVAEQGPLVATIYTALFWLAPVLFTRNIMRVIGSMVHVTSHGVFCKPNVVNQVMRYQKTGRAMFALLMISKIRTNLDSLNTPERKRKSSTADPAALVGREVVREVEAAFRVFDKDNSGSVDVVELGELLVSLGLPMSEAELAQVMSRLDCDGSGHVTQEEFVWWFAQQLTRSKEKSSSQVVDELFAYIDKDNSGTITLSEFASTIQSLHNGLSMDDILDLFRDIDKDHSGSVDKHEFKSMLLQYLGTDLL